MMLKPIVIALASVLALTACGGDKPAQPKAEKTEQPAEQKTETKTEQPSEAKAEQKAEQATSTDLSAQTAEYKAWVAQQMDSLVADSEKFVALLKEGKTDEAKAFYPAVRMHFERSEPVAELFGELDPKLDNREADLEQGETWTGFHAIEKILWTQNTTKGTENLADQLLTDAKALQAQVATAEVTPKLMIEGAVDLLNEVSTSKITGEEEIFSKTDLYVFRANVEGAEKIFEILKPELTAKNPELVKTLESEFKTVYALLDKYKTGESYKPYNELTADNTKELAEAITKLGEPLGQMGVIMQ